jgi:hypothetical protein
VAATVPARVSKVPLELLLRELGDTGFAGEARGENEVVDLEDAVFAVLADDLDAPLLGRFVVSRVALDGLFVARERE